jgi:hypothetical protein
MISTDNSIDVVTVREAVERSAMTHLDIAEALGWKDWRGFRDGKRVRRCLGLMPEYSRGHVTYRKRMGFPLAYQFAMVLGLDPVDLGL